MKRLLALVLSLALGWTLLGGVAQADIEANELAVASLTTMNGMFFTDMWGNNASDMDVRAMVHGYSTVAWAEEGNFMIDPTVVPDVKASDDGDKNRTYTFTLNKALCYNDGTPITAKDYVFYVLLCSSPQAQKLGGMTQAYNHLVGYADFQDGNPFAGVRLLGDDAFSLTIRGDCLPYFYELVMVDAMPAPLAVIAPGCDVLDDGQGAYVKGVDNPFDAALLQKTLLDPKTGYVSHPARTCGPYQLTAYDAKQHTAAFTRNPLYLGNAEGQKPTIENVTFGITTPEAMFEDLLSGKINLLNKVSEGDAITQGLQMNSEGTIRMGNYPRAGLNTLSFSCEQGPTESVYVRKAVALSIDEAALCQEYLKGYGLPVYAYYGLGQWMAQDQEALTALSQYSVNQNSAINMLETDGWIYNASGALYDAEKDTVRHKKMPNGKLSPLTLRCALAKDAGLTEELKRMLTDNLTAIGAQVRCDELPFPALLEQYYRQAERTYDIIQMASNFKVVFDPYYTFHTDEAYQGVHNVTGLRDRKLMELADEMRRVAPDDLEGYQQKWMAFQDYWVEVVPMVPLYSNVYFDFYHPKLQEYRINANVSWANALLYAYIGEPKPEEPTAETDLGAEGMTEGGEETVTFD